MTLEQVVKRKFVFAESAADLPVGVPVIDVATFKETSENLINGGFVLQMKGFNRPERLARKRSQQASGRLGSAGHRRISEGAIMTFDNLPQGLSLDLKDASSIFWTSDSRGMYVDDVNRKIYFGAVNEVMVLDMDSKDAYQVASSAMSPLAFVHSIDLSADKKKLLLTSAGFDMIVEVGLEDREPDRYWLANEGTLPSGDLPSSSKVKERGGAAIEKVVDRTGMATHIGGLGLPPAQRVAFPNGASYIDENRILATFFHQGLAEINLETGQSRSIDLSLSHPHAPLRFGDGFIVTDTGNGRAVVLNSDLEPSTIIDFKNLADMNLSVGGHGEWLQYVGPVNATDKKILAVDSNKESLVVVDLENQVYNQIHLNSNWVIQEAHAL